LACQLGLDAELDEKHAEALSCYKERLQGFQLIHDVFFSSLVLGVLAAVNARQRDKEAADSYH
jgi:hypothetical protein